ncbi:unnamed protein product [Prunus armeniaca]
MSFSSSSEKVMGSQLIRRILSLCPPDTLRTRGCRTALTGVGNGCNSTDHVDLPIYWLLRVWSCAQILIKFAFVDEAFNDFAEGDARFCIVAVILVVSTEHSDVFVSFGRELPAFRLWNHLIFIHENVLVSGVE